MPAARTRSRTVLAGLTAVAAAVAAVVVPGPAGASGASSTTTWVAQPLCTTAAVGHKSCAGMRLVPRRVLSTAGQRTVARPTHADGPAGGYSPGDLATAYGLHPNSTVAAHQTVAIVDAFDDRTVGRDLDRFDRHYGIRTETSSTFRLVNQRGGSTRPAPDPGWAGEITLDVQTVRGLCRTCKILLVETDSDSDASLAAGVNEAVKLHATEVSNSYGGPEVDPDNTPAVVKAYNHPGVVITASTGDDGWFDWDVINAQDGESSSNTPEIPAAYNTVVGVGGTSLYLRPDGTRAGETVWNSDGPTDAYGITIGQPLGAAGSGCSTLYGPKGWQQHVQGYRTLGCGTTKRSGVDIAADADPFTGYDIFEDYGLDAPAWSTVGGTSLASPMIAAMWALAGGSGGTNYPALSLYGHYRHDRTRPSYDVTVGGTGLCDTTSPAGCLQAVGQNPNTLGAGRIDCAFGAGGTAVLANRGQCYAQPGYDGVAGVGAPKGITGFRAMAPTAAIKSPGRVRHGVPKRFSSAGTSDPFPGGAIVKYSWHWGDGSPASRGPSPTHRYASRATRTVTLTVTDKYGRAATITRKITVA
jgi:hypothetical protein